MAAPTNLEIALRSIKRIGSFSEGEKDALQKAMRQAMFPGSWDIGTPSDDDIMQYDAATDSWKNETLVGGTFISLSDTPVTMVGQSGAMLVVSGVANELIFQDFNINTLNGLALGGLADNNILQYNSGTGYWEPEDLALIAPVISVNGNTATVVLDIDDVTPTTTKGDIIVEDGSNAIRLALGTDTHVLTADSAQPTGVKWAVSPAGFADPMTTRGDLIYSNSSAVTTRLAAGTVGQVLTSDGTDIAWAASVSGVTAFTGLSDVPASYVGHGSKYVAVNSGATALEFVSVTPITQVTASSPLASSGGTTPDISIQVATAAQHGYMSSTYATKLDGIENLADVTDATNVAAAGAFMGTVTVSASTPSGGDNGDIWFEIV